MFFRNLYTKIYLLEMVVIRDFTSTKIHSAGTFFAEICGKLNRTRLQRLNEVRKGEKRNKNVSIVKRAFH